jgi:hypothetical protein
VYRAYAARLVARLPKPASGSLAGSAVLGASDWHVRLSDDDIGVVCLIVSTAEHCQEMVGALARALAAKLEPADLASRVDMSEEEDELQGAITSCLASLLLGIETRLEGALAAMARLNWAGMEMAGDQSEYVGAFRRVLLDAAARLGPAMPPNYFRFFCDKLLRSFAPRFLENVYRCRKISDVGCQQMRLDTEVLKGALSELAKAGGHLDAAGQAAFAADVHAQLGRAEAVLKVVGSPPEGLVDTFFELMPQGSPSDFQRMLDLKVGAGEVGMWIVQRSPCWGPAESRLLPTQPLFRHGLIIISAHTFNAVHPFSPLPPTIQTGAQAQRVHRHPGAVQPPHGPPRPVGRCGRQHRGARRRGGGRSPLLQSAPDAAHQLWRRCSGGSQGQRGSAGCGGAAGQHGVAHHDAQPHGSQGQRGGGRGEHARLHERRHAQHEEQGQPALPAARPGWPIGVSRAARGASSCPCPSCASHLVLGSVPSCACAPCF